MKKVFLFLFVIGMLFVSYAMGQAPVASPAPVPAPAAPGLLDFLKANWVQVLVALLAVDQVLIGIFPKNAILGNISTLIKKVLPSGSQPPPAA